MTMIAISLSKANVVRAACRPWVASISTNATTDHQLQTQAVQDFHDHFWESVVSRSMKSEGSANNKIILIASSSSIQNVSPVQEQEDDKARRLRKCVREDLFKHFRMSATSRAMKRGDGVMSTYFSLSEKVQSTHCNQGYNALNTELPSLIDVATATKAREDMHYQFWSSYRARKDAQDTKASVTMSARTPIFASARHGQHLHKHHFKLPTTLNAYFEGSRIKGKDHRPRPMAITEIKPPFKIVDVNRDWTKLCGYTREEAVGSTLKEILQGPETNVVVAKDLIASLLQQSEEIAEHEAVLVNYRCDGRKFKNHARVGRIENEAGETTHFIGLFEKLGDDDLSSISNDDLYANT